MTFRLTEEEYQLAMDRMAANGLNNMSELARALLFGQEGTTLSRRLKQLEDRVSSQERLLYSLVAEIRRLTEGVKL